MIPGELTISVMRKRRQTIVAEGLRLERGKWETGFEEKETATVDLEES